MRRENGNDQNNTVAEVSKFFTFVSFFNSVFKKNNTVLVVYGVDHQ